ncbi:MAG: hypothetical protein Q9202_002481 [Teloschistes flavicans]
MPNVYHNFHPAYRFEFRNPFVARQLAYSILNAVYAVWLLNVDPKITQKLSYNFRPFPAITHFIAPTTVPGNEFTQVDVAIVYLNLLNELIKHDRTWPGAITVMIQDSHDETRGYLLIKRKSLSADLGNSTLLSPPSGITDPNDDGNSTTTSLDRPFNVPERVWLELIMRMMLLAFQQDSRDYVTADIPPGRQYRFTSALDPSIQAGIAVSKNLDPRLLDVTWKTIARAILMYEQKAALNRVWRSIDQWAVVHEGREFATLWIKRGGAPARAWEGGVTVA